MNIYETIINVGSLSVVIPTFIGILKAKSLSKNLRLLVLYLMFTSAKEITCLYLAYYSKMNLHIYNWTGVVEYLFIFAMYYNAFKSATFKKITLFLSIASTSFFLINILLIQGIYKFNSYSSILGNIVMSTVVLLFLFEILKSAEDINLIKTPLFWISAGLLFFSVGTLIVYSLYEIHAYFTKEIKNQIWSINSILYLLLNILFSIAFLCQEKKKISLS